MARVPVVVIGLPDTDKKLGTDAATLVTPGLSPVFVPLLVPLNVPFCVASVPSPVTSVFGMVVAADTTEPFPLR